MEDSFDSFTMMPGLGSSSRLMSESPLLQTRSLSHSDTGPGGDDLSISELSLSDRAALNLPRPFSLLARSERAPSTPSRDNNPFDEDGEFDERVPDDDHDGEGDELNEEGDETIDQEKMRRIAERSREDKLRSDVFILRKLNSAFAAFNEALEEAGSANERIATQFEQTDALLNQYMHMLSNSEEISRLIFDEEWQGSEADEAILEQERIAAEARARKEAEERALALQKEKERREREERERIEAQEKARIEDERQMKLATRGGVTGVRGTRASMRGMRGSSVSTRGRGTSSGTSTRSRATSSTSQTNSKRSTMGAGSSASGIPTRGSSGVPRRGYNPS